MSKINKVLYNVDQRDSTKGEVNTREDMWMARHNIGLDEVVGQATVTEGGKEYTGIAPLGTNGLVPAEFLPSYVDAVVEGYYYNGEFYSDASHTQKITPDTHTTYVDITDQDAGIGYRYTERDGEGYYFQISSQNAFGRIAVGDSSIVTADRPMDTLKVVGDHWIGVAIADIAHVDTLTITHNNYVGAGTIGSKTDTEGRNTFTIPWADYDDQGHIVGTGTRTHKILDASTSAVGVVKLTSTYGNDETMAVTQKGVQQAIAQLDYGNKLAAGKFISALSQTDGKIDYTVTNMDTTPTDNSTNPVTSGGVKAAINALDATKTYSGTNFSVTVTEADGVITGVTGTDNTANKTHDHGSISSAGKVTVAATTKKALLITDTDNFAKVGPAFGTDSGDANLFLNKQGEWTNVSAIGNYAVCYVDSTSHGLKTIYITSSTDSSHVFASGLTNSYVGNGGNYISVNAGTGLYVESGTSSSDFGKLSLKMQTDRTAVGNGSLAWSHSVGCFWFCSPQIRVHANATAYATAHSNSTGNSNTYLEFQPGFSEGLITAVQFTGASGISVSSAVDSSNTNVSKMTFKLTTASSGTLGGVCVGYNETDKNYAVKLDSSGKAFVTVPWTDNSKTLYVDSYGSNGLGTLYVTSDASKTVGGSPFASGLKSTYVSGWSNYMQINTGTGLYVEPSTSSDDFGKLSLVMADAAGQIGNGTVAWSYGSKCFWFSSPQIRVGSSAGAYITGNQTTTNNNTYLLFNPGFSEGLITGVQFIGSNGITVKSEAASGDTTMAKMTITMPNTFRITEGSYSSTPEGIQMRLVCSDTSSGASVGIYKESGAAIAWPSSSTATKLGYLAPAFASGTTGKMLVVDNGKVVWNDISARDTVIKYSGSPSLTDVEYDTMTDAIGSDNLATIMYGAGSGSTYWHLMKVDASGYTFDNISSAGSWRNMDVGSDKKVSISTKGYLAPAINPSDKGKVLVASHDGIMAFTKWETNFAVPTFGKYDLATSSGGTMYINTDILPSSYVSSYLCSYTSALSTTDTTGTSILCIPPHHRGSAHCIVSGSSQGEASQGSTSWIRFYLTDTKDPTAEPGTFGASALWHGYGMWLGSSNMDFKHASFIYRNDSDQSKYITCFIGSSSPPASFTIHKEFEMFPTE